jgi:hypothetical protein
MLTPSRDFTSDWREADDEGIREIVRLMCLKI